jgi:hypothetical protein
VPAVEPFSRRVSWTAPPLASTSTAVFAPEKLLNLTTRYSPATPAIVGGAVGLCRYSSHAPSASPARRSETTRIYDMSVWKRLCTCKLLGSTHVEGVSSCLAIPKTDIALAPRRKRCSPCWKHSGLGALVHRKGSVDVQSRLELDVLRRFAGGRRMASRLLFVPRMIHTPAPCGRLRAATERGFEKASSVRGEPWTFVIGPDGRVRIARPGYGGLGSLRAAVEQALSSTRSTA